MPAIFSQLIFNKMEKESNDKKTKDSAELLKNLQELTITSGWNNQRTNKGTLVWYTGPNGVVTAMTFIPD